MRRFIASLVDVADMLADALPGRRGEPFPPRSTFAAVGGARDFRRAGREFLGYFRDLCGLRPDERVLEVGCGIGRMALPLTKYLSPAGSYDGFDVASDGVEWCRQHVTPRYPNFRFQVADVYNGVYNPAGRTQPREYRFPHEDESFDLVFLTSVFTHMLPWDVEHYLSEIARVLRVEGRCLITYFLLNPETLRFMEERKPEVNFWHQRQGYRVMDPTNPEAAVAYEESDIRALYARLGLRVVEPIYLGGWSRRPNWLTGQDLAIAVKTPPRQE